MVEDLQNAEDIVYALENAQAIDARGGNFSTFAYGQTSTSTADTAVQLNGGNSLSIPDGATLRIKALGGNGNALYVGDSNVTTGSGYELAGGESLRIKADDVSDFWIVDGTGGVSVSWLVEQ